MFSDNPKKYFRGAQIDVVEFPEGIDAKVFNERIFEGPIQKQLTDALSYIKTIHIQGRVIKHSDRPEADNIFNYPIEAIEEGLSNAVYHRNYELQEPIEFRILPEAIEIISYNGVDPSIKQRDFEKGIIRARRYRNRRIGEFLKELELTEGRGTGIPTIRRVLKNNGSESPIFDTDDPDRRYFILEIPIHPDFKGIEAEEKVMGAPIEESGGPIEQEGGPIKQKSSEISGPIILKDKTIILTDRQLEVLNLLKNEPKLSRKNLADKLQINESAIQSHLDALKEKGILERVGGTRGFWLVKFKK